MQNGSRKVECTILSHIGTGTTLGNALDPDVRGVFSVRASDTLTAVDHKECTEFT